MTVGLGTNRSTTCRPDKWKYLPNYHFYNNAVQRCKEETHIFSPSGVWSFRECGKKDHCDCDVRQLLLTKSTKASLFPSKQCPQCSLCPRRSHCALPLPPQTETSSSIQDLLEGFLVSGHRHTGQAPLLKKEKRSTQE